MGCHVNSMLKFVNAYKWAERKPHLHGTLSKSILRAFFRAGMHVYTNNLAQGSRCTATLGPGSSSASTKRSACRKRFGLLACSVSIKGCTFYSSGSLMAMV